MSSVSSKGSGKSSLEGSLDRQREPDVEQQRPVENSSLAFEKRAEVRAPPVNDWDGPDDPEHPLNWSKTQKNLHLVIVSLFTLAA